MPKTLERSPLPTVSPNKPLPHARKRIEKSDRKKLSKTDPPVLKEIKRRLQNLLAVGKTATRWEIFAPMVNIQSSGTVKPFIPYDYQIDLVQTIEENQNTVIVKSRQMGLSESICSYLLMRAVTEPGFAAVVFSKTQGDSSELSRRIRGMAVSLGELCPELIAESATKIEFRRLGRIHFLPVTARAARGIPSVSVVLFDEAAFIDGIDGVYQAAMPTLSMLGDRGKVIFNSTPNGRSGLFYRLLVGGVGEQHRVKDALASIRDRSELSNEIKPFERKQKHTRIWVHKGWAKVFLHWRCHPVYGSDPDWGEKTKEDRQLTEAQFNVEYELDFQEESRLLFSPELVDLNAIATWEEPKWGHRYIAGVDINLGGADYFTAQVIDITSIPYKLVAEYHECRRGKDYNLSNSSLLIAKYNPDCVAVESNNGGIFYCEEYAKLYPAWRIQPVCTTNQSKIANTDRISLLLERHTYRYPPDSSFAQEAPHFIEIVKKAVRVRCAESGKHDDGVMASAIAFAVLDSVIGIDTLELYKAVL